MNIRSPKPDDQKQAEQVFLMIEELVKKHPEIDPNIWVSGCFSLITQSYLNSGIDYEDYASDLLKAIQSYKSWWEK